MALDTDPRIRRAVRLLAERLHPAAVVLFGSRAGGRARPDPPDRFAIAGLTTELEDIRGHSVDLVVLNAASPILAMEVLRSHRVLSERDPEAFEAFTVRTLSAHFDLERARAPIERAILSAGAA